MTTPEPTNSPSASSASAIGLPGRRVQRTAFSQQLRALIHTSGKSLRMIRSELLAAGHSVSLATLSAWQSGARKPSAEKTLAAVDALETILHAEPGSIRDLVGEKRMTLSAASDVVTVDFHVLVRALRSGRCRSPSIHVLRDDEPNLKPPITNMRGCTIGEEIDWPDERTYGTELILDDDAAAGALLFCDFQLRWPAQAQDVQEATYSVTRAAREILVQVEFDDDLAPVNCRQFTETKAGEKIEQVQVNASNRLQPTGKNFGPGRVGLK